LALAQPLSQHQIHCKEQKPLTQQSVMTQPSCQVTDFHPLATLTLKHEDHQKWP
jgi:hypothetical protein